MPDLQRIDALLRAANPAPVEDDVMREVRQTDPLWQTIRSRIDEDAPLPVLAATDPVIEEVAGIRRGAVDLREAPTRSWWLVAAAVVTALAVTAGVLVRTAAPPSVDPADEPGVVEPAVPVVPGPDDVGFTWEFSGADGAEGCRRDGPGTVRAGRYESTFVNTSADAAAIVTIVELTPDHDHQDFLDFLATRGDGFPVLMLPEDADPSRHDWMADDEWWEVHQAGPGGTHRIRTLLTLQPGRYVAFCWTEVPDGMHLWPLGPLTVTE